jgi:hypothetical protein
VIAGRGSLCPAKSTAQFTENAVLDKSDFLPVYPGALKQLF